MRLCLAVLAAFAALAVSTPGSTQEVPYQIVPVTSRSDVLVHDPVSTPPPFNPENEFLVFELYGEEGDIPFVVFPNGEVVSREAAEAFIAQRLQPGKTMLLLCSYVPPRGTFNIYNREHRTRCEVRR